MMVQRLTDSPSLGPMEVCAAFLLTLSFPLRIVVALQVMSISTKTSTDCKELKNVALHKIEHSPGLRHSTGTQLSGLRLMGDLTFKTTKSTVYEVIYGGP